MTRAYFRSLGAGTLFSTFWIVFQRSINLEYTMHDFHCNHKSPPPLGSEWRTSVIPVERESRISPGFFSNHCSPILKLHKHPEAFLWMTKVFRKTVQTRCSMWRSLSVFIPKFRSLYRERKKLRTREGGEGILILKIQRQVFARGCTGANITARASWKSFLEIRQALLPNSESTQFRLEYANFRWLYNHYLLVFEFHHDNLIASSWRSSLHAVRN